MFFLIILLIIASIMLIIFGTMPTFFDKMKIWSENKEKNMEIEMDRLFYYDKSPKQIMRLYFILPPILGAAGFIFTQNMIFAGIGVFLGLLIPNVVLKFRDSLRRMKFNSQILDSILILSSSLKGGLSLLQAFEVLVDEIPPPMSQEMGLVVRENKMGVSMEESLRRLSKRMTMDELTLVVNSILVARETGGDLTKVFSRLTTTIRDNNKLKDNVRTLTLQGRLQGIIMSVIPFVFIWWVITFNREHFNIMLQSDTGRGLLVLALVLQSIGMVLIKRFSSVKI
ncbi:MAG: type II secretion system F family protein [Candidatus Omnitrophota bacterium]|jgi:tight adherence protein B